MSLGSGPPPAEPEPDARSNTPPPPARVQFLAHILGIGDHADALHDVLHEESERLRESQRES